MGAQSLSNQETIAPLTGPSFGVHLERLLPPFTTASPIENHSDSFGVGERFLHALAERRFGVGYDNEKRNPLSHVGLGLLVVPRHRHFGPGENGRCRIERACRLVVWHESPLRSSARPMGRTTGYAQAPGGKTGKPFLSNACRLVKSRLECSSRGPSRYFAIPIIRGSHRTTTGKTRISSTLANCTQRNGRVPRKMSAVGTFGSAPRRT